MSGFFGMLRLDGEPVRESLLTEIAEELRFRGPDGAWPYLCLRGTQPGYKWREALLELAKKTYLNWLLDRDRGKRDSSLRSE
jgi:hypothetical protein